jgi:CDP-glycerol glycerophosphotransferase (TagB/SpsB family)
MSLFPIYIDPGTGSALFSIAIGIAAASFFFVRSLILKLKVSFFRKEAADLPMYKYVIYAEDKRYWLFFKPILDEFETRQTEVLYLTTSSDDPVFSVESDYIKGKYIGQGNKAFAYLNLLSANIVLATTPDLDVLQWKRSKNVNHYCHIIHAASGSTLYRLFGLDYYDTIFLSGENEVPEIRYLESARKLREKELVVVGNTYFDVCVDKIKQIPVEKNHQFTVLVSPSWGPSALLKVFGVKLLDPLGKTGWRIIVRPHPQSAISEKPVLEALEEKYRDNPNIEWDYNHENIYALARSDVMISDFSGIIYDYVFLFDRPVLINTQNMDLRRLDAHCLKEEPSYLRTLKKIGMELDGSCLDSIKDTVSNLLRNTELQKIRLEAKKAMWQNPGESGKRIVDFMMETVNKGVN